VAAPTSSLPLTQGKALPNCAQVHERLQPQLNEGLHANVCPGEVAEALPQRQGSLPRWATLAACDLFCWPRAAPVPPVCRVRHAPYRTHGMRMFFMSKIVLCSPGSTYFRKWRMLLASSVFPPNPTHLAVP